MLTNTQPIQLAPARPAAKPATEIRGVWRRLSDRWRARGLSAYVVSECDVRAWVIARDESTALRLAIDGLFVDTEDQTDLAIARLDPGETLTVTEDGDPHTAQTKTFRAWAADCGEGYLAGTEW